MYHIYFKKKSKAGIPWVILGYILCYACCGKGTNNCRKQPVKNLQFILISYSPTQYAAFTNTHTAYHNISLV